MRSRKHTGLLLYLVANPHTVHVRDELAYLLWDGHDRKARHSLSQALYDIRSKLSSLLSVNGRAVRLLPNRIVYELDAFERAFQAKDHETVIELYRGAFAPELSDLGPRGSTAGSTTSVNAAACWPRSPSEASSARRRRAARGIRCAWRRCDWSG